MKRIAAFFALTALAFSGCTRDVHREQTIREPYSGFGKDVLLLRDTAPASTEDQTLRGSSAQASLAARRVFTRIDYIGKPKAEVFAMLGDPKTVSSYGIAAQPGENTPLVYRFDSGFGGWQYTLHFTNGVVAKVEEQGLD